MACGVFVGCNNNDDGVLQEMEIKLTSEIIPTRVNSLNYQSTQVVQGQKIGVTIVNAKSVHNNVAWIAGNNGMLINTDAKLYWGNSDITITAYHPFNIDWTESSHEFSVNVDQSANMDYLNSDLLWTTTTASKTENPISLNFQHKLAKINVTLISEDIDDLSNATIYICGTNVTTNFNPNSGELSGSNNTQDIIAGTTKANVYTASAIIIPQTVMGGTQFIKVNHNNKKFIYTLPADTTFESGHSYSYTLKIKEELEEVEVESGNITDWDDEGFTGDLVEDILEKSVNVQVAGTLSELITEEEKYTLKTLKISGAINGDDVRFFREMAGFDVDGEATNGQLICLDLSDANIVEGGGPYLNEGASFEGFWYGEGSRVGQYMLDAKYTSENNSSCMFIGLKQLKQLILPKSLVNLGDLTFYGCHKLKSITLPATIDYSLSYSAHFNACLSLETINVEEGHPSLFSRDGVLYENDGDKITLLAIPAARTTFTLTSDVYQIASYAVPLGCSLNELIITENAPELVPDFYDNLFSLQNFIVDDNNNRYATIDGVLYSKDLTTIECYPSGRTASTYEIPNGVIAIGDGCFNTSGNLSEIIIPEGVETIGDCAFFYCYNLHELTLPTTIKNIGSGAFQHLNMTKLTCKALTPPIICNYVFASNGKYEKICVPAESVELYKVAEYWNALADNIYPIE